MLKWLGAGSMSVIQEYCKNCGQSKQWIDPVLNQQKRAWCRRWKHDIPLKCLKKHILCCAITLKSITWATPAVKAWKLLNYMSEWTVYKSARTHQTSSSSSSSSSSSPYICHGVGPLVDPFRSHLSRSLFRGLPWLLLPLGEQCFITLGNLLWGILFTCCIQFLLYSSNLSKIGVIFNSGEILTPGKSHGKKPDRFPHQMF